MEAGFKTISSFCHKPDDNSAALAMNELDAALLSFWGGVGLQGGRYADVGIILGHLTILIGCALCPLRVVGALKFAALCTNGRFSHRDAARSLADERRLGFVHLHNSHRAVDRKGLGVAIDHHSPARTGSLRLG